MTFYCQMWMEQLTRCPVLLRLELPYLPTKRWSMWASAPMSTWPWVSRPSDNFTADWHANTIQTVELHGGGGMRETR